MLLHGFAGTGRLWDPVIAGLGPERYRPLAPDLRGHGAASARRPVGFDVCVEDVLALAPSRFALAGYSLGGRIALHVALAAPERVTRLVLVASTAGIEDDAERAERAAADAALARRAESGGIEDFVREWTANPVFAGTPPDAAAAWEADIRRNEPAGLAAALRGLGTGLMTPLWNRLGELPMPVTVVVGERDAKFVALGERLASTIPEATLVTVQGAGHGVPREAPAALAALLTA